jgi:hypothetical protein
MDLSTEDISDAKTIAILISAKYYSLRDLTPLAHWEMRSLQYNLRRNRSQFQNRHKLDLSWIYNVALREFVAAKIAEAQMAAV